MQPKAKTHFTIFVHFQVPSFLWRQFLDCHVIEATAAGDRAPPPAAFPLGDSSLGPGAAARPAGKAPPQEAAP